MQRIREACAPKDETTKKLNQLSRKIKELYEFIGRDQGSNDDGMLTKRRLGPNACASCDKNLANLQGL